MLTDVISLSESDLLTVVRSFLLDALPVPMQVMQGQPNRVPEPTLPDFVTMTPILRQRLATNIVDTHDGSKDLPPTAGIRTDTQRTQITIQLDVHGPLSADNSQIIATLFRSELCADFFAEAGIDAAPLYEADPRQVPYINGEQQIENRYVLDLVLQANIAVETAQQFADTLTVGANGIISVEATYPAI